MIITEISLSLDWVNWLNGVIWKSICVIVMSHSIDLNDGVHVMKEIDSDSNFPQ